MSPPVRLSFPVCGEYVNVITQIHREDVLPIYSIHHLRLAVISLLKPLVTTNGDKFTDLEIKLIVTKGERWRGEG